MHGVLAREGTWGFSPSHPIPVEAQRGLGTPQGHQLQGMRFLLLGAASGSGTLEDAGFGVSVWENSLLAGGLPRRSQCREKRLGSGASEGLDYIPVIYSQHLVIT